MPKLDDIAELNMEMEGLKSTIDEQEEQLAALTKEKDAIIEKERHEAEKLKIDNEQKDKKINEITVEIE